MSSAAVVIDALRVKNQNSVEGSMAPAGAKVTGRGY